MFLIHGRKCRVGESRISLEIATLAITHSHSPSPAEVEGKVLKAHYRVELRRVLCAEFVPHRNVLAVTRYFMRGRCYFRQLQRVSNVRRLHCVCMCLRDVSMLACVLTLALFLQIKAVVLRPNPS